MLILPGEERLGVLLDDTGQRRVSWALALIAGGTRRRCRGQLWGRVRSMCSQVDCLRFEWSSEISWKVARSSQGKAYSQGTWRIPSRGQLFLMLRYDYSSSGPVSREHELRELASLAKDSAAGSGGSSKLATRAGSGSR
jgi:hypothetical protein